MTKVPCQPMMETYEQDHMLSCLRDRVDDKLCLDAASEIDALKARIEELENALKFLLETRWKSVDKDNMEFEGRVTCYQLDRARSALQPKAGS